MADELDVDQLAAEAVQAMRRYVEALVAVELGRLNNQTPGQKHDDQD